MVVFYWCGQMNRKQIKVTITLSGKEESFTDDANQNRLSSTGFRVMCDISYGFGAVMPTAQIRIYGLAMETMNKLFRVQWNTLGLLMNMVKIEVGEQGKPLIKEFEGNITFATIDFSNAPDVALVIQSQGAALDYLRPESDISYKGEVDIADIVKEICDGIGYQFDNNGVSVKAQNVEVGGTAIGKIISLSERYSFDLYIDQNSVSITKKGGARNLKIPVITPETGLIGYPVPDTRGVSFRCLYDPMIKFGGICKIQDSVVTVCNRDWRVYGLYKSLESNVPNGNWFCEVNATWSDAEDAAINK